MVRSTSIMLTGIIILTILISGCTSGQDVTPIVKSIPEVQQFLKEHPDAKITVTYWSKEEVTKFEQEISQQCDKPVTSAAMYKAVISEGDLKSIAWIDATTQTLICSTTEGKGGTPTITPVLIVTPGTVQTPIPTSSPLFTPTPVPTSTPAPVSTAGDGSLELKNGYMLTWVKVGGIAQEISPDGSIGYSKSAKAFISLQLIHEGRVVNEQTVTEGNTFSLYYEGKQIVKATFKQLFLGATGYMITIDNLAQYDTTTSGMILTKDRVTLALSYSATDATFTPIPTFTSTPVPTITPNTPTPVPTITPITPTPLPTPTSTYTEPIKTLTQGESWHIGDVAGSDFSRGYILFIVDVHYTNATPIDPELAQKQVRIFFKKNSVNLDAQNVAIGETYTYNDIFSTTVESIYTAPSGADFIRFVNTTIAK